MSTCATVWCDRDAIARGLCKRCYDRYRRGISPISPTKRHAVAEDKARLRDQITMRREAGQSIADIAAAVGVNTSTASRWLLEWDFEAGLTADELEELRRRQRKHRSGKLTTEQINEARATGVRFSPPYHAPKPKPPTGAERREAEMLRKLSLLEDFYRSHGHINVGQLVGTKDWPGAGRCISRIRALNRRGKLPQSVVRAAEEMNLDWNPGTGR